MSFKVRQLSPSVIAGAQPLEGRNETTNHTCVLVKCGPGHFQALFIGVFNCEETFQLTVDWLFIDFNAIIQSLGVRESARD